ncbi:MAG: GntR family transcriptional regulator [Clostridia bacterium]|jgi:GntR family transcriptional regulator|nr:GntR family transcriptional regulator [Clostridia bacterium]MCI1959795.1 GntR family transcriptional regulator [Clostridia bacterium]MCI1999199.1 GntR family transcriptional regulator [Clostridia bacterium]MCI2014848.1 GntR family transcriptional regulator [Clostridia bacterium]
MIIIDYKDARPIYEQIVDKFQVLITKGALKPDSQMPSVRSLAVDLSINPNTIQKAYAELERLGFIYTVKGRGSFISDSDSYRKYVVQELRNRLDDIIVQAENIGISKGQLVLYISKGEEGL